MTRPLFIAFVLSLFIGFPAVAAMTLAVDAQGVTVSNVAAGSRVILFGVGREPLGYQSKVRRWTEVLTDEDHDGVVRFTAASTRKSIWIAVDFDRGDAVAATGPDYPRREVTAGFGVKRNNAGQLSKLENARGIADLIVVRPGRGAWRRLVLKHSPVDETRGRPETMRIDAGSLEPVNGLPSDDLKHVRRGDVLAMIDPTEMEFYVTTVNED